MRNKNSIEKYLLCNYLQNRNNIKIGHYFLIFLLAVADYCRFDEKIQEAQKDSKRNIIMKVKYEIFLLMKFAIRKINTELYTVQINDLLSIIVPVLNCFKEELLK